MLQQNRLKLLNVTPQMIDWVKEGDSNLAQKMKIKVAQNWCENSKEVLDLVQEEIEADLEIQQWMFYFAILSKENLLVGNGGFKGYPKNGIVEIGYEIADSYRNRGLASELVNILIEIAFSNKGASTIVAHTLEYEGASAKVLKKNGFIYKGQFNNPMDGVVYRYEKVQNSVSAKIQ